MPEAEGKDLWRMQQKPEWVQQKKPRGATPQEQNSPSLDIGICVKVTAAMAAF